MTQGIYCYIDKKNNTIIYIGRDSYINKKSRHRHHFYKGAYDLQPINRILQNNPDKYKYKVLEKGNISNKILNGLEMAFIQKYSPKFNFTKGGEGCSGRLVSSKTRDKIRKSLRGKKFSEEHKKNISKSKKGKPLSEEHKKNMSKAKKGENNPMFGRKRSREELSGLIIANITSSRLSYFDDFWGLVYLMHRKNKGLTQREIISEIGYKSSGAISQKLKNLNMSWEDL